MIYWWWTTPLWKSRSGFIQISVPWPSKPWYLVLLGVSLSPGQCVRLVLLSEPACPILPRHCQLSLPWQMLCLTLCLYRSCLWSQILKCNPNFWQVLANSWNRNATNWRTLAHHCQAALPLRGVWCSPCWLYVTQTSWAEGLEINPLLSCPSNKLDIAKGFGRSLQRK